MLASHVQIEVNASSTSEPELRLITNAAESVWPLTHSRHSLIRVANFIALSQEIVAGLPPVRHALNAASQNGAKKLVTFRPFLQICNTNSLEDLYSPIDVLATKEDYLWLGIWLA
nr:unnamed protein product [Haemonchus contortus]